LLTITLLEIGPTLIAPVVVIGHDGVAEAERFAGEEVGTKRTGLDDCYKETKRRDFPSTTVLTNYSIFRPQHGHRSRRASSAAASSSRNVVMESATCRCLRRGAPGPEAFG
jgi:hypothetical protein